MVAEGTGGSSADAVRELPGTGTYVTTAHWPPGKTGLGLRYTINSVENYESALPDAMPTTSGKDEPKEDRVRPRAMPPVCFMNSRRNSLSGLFMRTPMQGWQGSRRATPDAAGRSGSEHFSEGRPSPLGGGYRLVAYPFGARTLLRRREYSTALY